MNALTGPILMFNHCLDELKGWPDEAALDFDAFLSPNVTVDPVYGGSCVHVNTLGEFELGVGNTDMGIFLLQGSHELDVSNYGGNQWYPIAPTGKMSGLVAAGGFELETTEFYWGPATGTPAVPPTTNNLEYVPGMQLTSPTQAVLTAAAETDMTKAGKLFNSAAWGTTPSTVQLTNLTAPICAVCSRHSHINHHRVPVLSFWPVYMPKCN